jgi:hypothetical protein
MKIPNPLVEVVSTGRWLPDRVVPADGERQHDVVARDGIQACIAFDGGVARGDRRRAEKDHEPVHGPQLTVKAARVAPRSRGRAARRPRAR